MCMSADNYDTKRNSDRCTVVKESKKEKAAAAGT